MEPFTLAFYILKSKISNFQFEIIHGTFEVESDGYNDNIIEDLAKEDKVLVEDRYELKVNNVFYRYFFDDLITAFNEFNWEIRTNLESSPLRESIPSYLEKLDKELKTWFDNITVQEIPLNDENKKLYLQNNIDLSFSKSEGISSLIIENISSLFLFIKKQILETLENIDKIEKIGFDRKDIEVPEELFSNISSPYGPAGVLDIYQTALLFYYLKKYKGINPLSAESLARLVSALTGHSFQNIRTSHGFGAIADICADKAKNQNFKEIPNYNLTILKAFLNEIMKDIEAQSVKNHP